MTLFYPDLSHYQAGANIAGCAAVVVKATQGTSYVDPAYTDFKAQADALGITFAAYHWVDSSDAAVQAAHLFGVVGAVPVMWDAEAIGATVAEVLAVTARLRALGGNPRLVYLPHWWWVNLGSPDLRQLTAAGLGLVSSVYPAGGYSDSGPGWAPYGNVQPVVWQYTDQAPVGGERVDRNAYKGTVDQFRALLGLTTSLGDTMRIFALPSGYVVVTDGVTRRHLVEEPDTANGAKAVACITNAWGVQVTPVTAAMLDGRSEEQWMDVACGLDVATLTASNSATDHTHETTGTTGPAVLAA